MLWQLLHIEINNPFAVKNSVQSYCLWAKKGIKINNKQNWHQLWDGDICTQVLELFIPATLGWMAE